MKMTHSVRGLDSVLRIWPETDIEGEVIQSYAPYGEPLTATIKKDPGYDWGHIEIRKEADR